MVVGGRGTPGNLDRLRSRAQGARLPRWPGDAARPHLEPVPRPRRAARAWGRRARRRWRRRPVDDGVHVHLNRKLTGLMADRVRAWAPDVCALQEVPTAAVREIVARTGMLAVGTTTGPADRPAAPARRARRAQPRPLAHPRGQRQPAADRPGARARAGQRARRAAQPGSPPSCARRCGCASRRRAAALPARAAPGGDRPRPRRPAAPRSRSPACTATTPRHPELIAMELAPGDARRSRARRRGRRWCWPATSTPRRRTPRSRPLAAGGWSGAPAAAGRRHRPDPHARARGGGARAGAAGRRARGGRDAGEGGTRRVRLSDHDPVAAHSGELRVSGSPAGPPAAAMSATATAPHRSARSRSSPSQSASGHTSGNASRPKRAIEVIVPLRQRHDEDRRRVGDPRGAQAALGAPERTSSQA